MWIVKWKMKINENFRISKLSVRNYYKNSQLNGQHGRVVLWTQHFSQLTQVSVFNSSARQSSRPSFLSAWQLWIWSQPNPKKLFLEVQLFVFKGRWILTTSPSLLVNCRKTYWANYFPIFNRSNRRDRFNGKVTFQWDKEPNLYHFMTARTTLGRHRISRIEMKKIIIVSTNFRGKPSLSI